jgi:hypothetical protein
VRHAYACTSTDGGGCQQEAWQALQPQAAHRGDRLEVASHRLVNLRNKPMARTGVATDELPSVTEDPGDRGAAPEPDHAALMATFGLWAARPRAETFQAVNQPPSRWARRLDASSHLLKQLPEAPGPLL